MNVQVKALAAPLLREAIVHNGKLILFVHNLADPAHGEVQSYLNASKGDNITFKVSTSTGNEYSQELPVESPADAPFEFKIPKKTFEEKFVKGATAKLSYRVQTSSGNTAQSAELLVYLEH
ncbi:hypothetical protein NZ35_00620 [Pseudomonas chlororaphis]|uniref:Uncharacterized protein n=1 Tax=Pseudomonas chlororaphis TaxID=587753 RepID=A0A0A6DG05_9PSED|nr:hypothetical protein NZ35_00620 [Pseudomonas chlororaphis]